MAGCSSDDGEDRRDMATVELVPYASNFLDVEPMTRATQPTWAPDGYYEYSTLTGVDAMMTTNENAAIGTCFTSGTTSGDVRKFRRNASGKWLVDEEITAGSYNLYGFVPYTSVDVNRTTIDAHGSTYAAGATMKLRGLNSVMNQDVCVIVGAKHGTKEGESAPVPSVNPMKAGDFSCTISSGTSNYVFLLFDHLYAGLRFRFRVDSDYAQLRTIKLKKLELTAYQDDACTIKMSQNIMTTVTLSANNTGDSPIEGSVEFSADDGVAQTPMTPVLIFNGNVELKTGDQYTDYVGFVPKTSNYFILRSTYDVCDKKGNVVRKDCVAENKLNTLVRFNTELQRGYMYSLKLTVMPTYLYVLSDPDLDNPSIMVN